MKVEILKDINGYEDNILRCFKKGDIVTIGDSLVKNFKSVNAIKEIIEEVAVEDKTADLKLETKEDKPASKPRRKPIRKGKADD